MAAKHRKTRALLAALAAAAALFACPAIALAADEQLSVEVTPTVPCHVKADGSVMTADASAWAITNKGADEVTVSKVSAVGGAGAEAADVAVKAKVGGADWFSYHKGAFVEPASELSIPGNNGSINAQWEVAGKLDPSANADILKQAATPQGYDLVAFSFKFEKKGPEAYAVVYKDGANGKVAKLYKRDKIPAVGEIIEGKEVIDVITGIENREAIFKERNNATSRLTTVEVVDTGIKPITMERWFEGCQNLASLKLEKLDTSQVTSMYCMFHDCSKLTTLDLSGFDTSSVTDMGWMFHECGNLTSVNVSSFNTSNVTNMFAMFYECSSLKSLSLRNFDTSKVTNMSLMFSYCRELTTLDVSSFKTPTVKNITAMFQSCDSLTSLDLSNFDTSQVGNMGNMFSGCGSLTSLNLSNFDTSQVTDMSRMLRGCYKLSTLDLSGWNTLKVKSWKEFLGGDGYLSPTPVTCVKLTGQLWSDEGLRKFPSNLYDKSGKQLTDAAVKQYMNPVEFSSLNKPMASGQIGDDSDFDIRSTEVGSVSSPSFVDANDGKTVQELVLESGIESDSDENDNRMTGEATNLSSGEAGTLDSEGKLQESSVSISNEGELCRDAFTALSESVH